MTISLHIPAHPLAGQVQLPGSKSLSNRVLMIRALSGSSFVLENVSDSDDTRHLHDALEAIAGGISASIDIGHAGTDMRFLTAYLASREGSYELTGSERMQQRPIGELVSVLRSLGAEIAYRQREGFPPLLIKGRQLEGGEAAIRGDISSQFISALLMIAPYFKKGIDLRLSGNIVSKPYIAMTIETMKAFGAEVAEAGSTIRVEPVPYRHETGRCIIESDWSAASYYYSIVALSPPGTHLVLHGLMEKSLQADAVCAMLYRSFGVETRFAGKSVALTKTAQSLPEKMSYDFTDCPDIAQTLVCTCAALNRPFHFTGLQTLKVKETDRILALQQELRKLGISVEATTDSLSYDGASMPGKKPVTIATYKDHRMAMSFAPIALIQDGISIEESEVVSKSYPGFWNDLRKIGFILKP